MLLCLYQIFIFLLGHLHFFLHFLFTFMENHFKNHPIFIHWTFVDRVCHSSCSSTTTSIILFASLPSIDSKPRRSYLSVVITSSLPFSQRNNDRVCTAVYHHQVLEVCREENVGLLCWNPLKDGLLTCANNDSEKMAFDVLKVRLLFSN